MTDPRSFDDILDSALDELRAGQPIAAILAKHPAHAAVLRSLLETAALGINSASQQPNAARLDAKFSIVSAALADARRAHAVSSDKRVQWSPRSAIAAFALKTTRAFSELSEKRVQWAPRRLAFASLSLPAFAIAAIVVAGTGGAAAAAIVVEQPRFARILADAVTPDWAIQIRSDDPGAGQGYPPASSVETPTAVPTVASSETATASAADGNFNGTPVTGEQPDKSATPADDKESKRTPSPGKDATPATDHRQNETPTHGSDDDPESSETPGNSGDAPGHTATPHAGVTPPASDHTPGNGSNNGNGHESTSTPEADDGHGNSSNAGNGNGNKGGAKEKGNGNSSDE